MFVQLVDMSAVCKTISLLNAAMKVCGLADALPYVSRLLQTFVGSVTYLRTMEKGDGLFCFDVVVSDMNYPLNSLSKKDLRIP